MTGHRRNLGTILDGAAPANTKAIIELNGDGGAETLTFGDLYPQINAITKRLIDERLPAKSSIAIFAGTSPSHLSAFLAVMRAGHIAVPINIKLSPSEIGFLIGDSGATRALFEPEFQTLIPPGLTAIDISHIDSIQTISTYTCADDQLPDIATLMYTSGSTGKPKGVPIRHDGYIWAFESFLSLRDQIKEKIGLVAAPLFHMNGQFHLINMLSCGATVVLMRDFSAQGLLNAIDRFGVFRATGVPTMYALGIRALDAGHQAKLGSVKMLALGSAPLSKPLLARLQSAFPNAAITNGYGTTETGPVSFGNHPSNLPTPTGSIGYPMPGVDVRLSGDPDADEGVLFIRNQMTLSAYHNRPQITAQRLSKGWYETGDLMRRDANGFYYFVGRADDMMIVGGENVYPRDVEKRLEQHPAVAEAAVVAVPDEIKNEKPVAFVVLNKDRSADEETLKAYALETGPAYAHPRRVFLVPELPLSPANKVDKARLRRWANEQRAP